MTTEEFVIPDDQINHYATLAQWMDVRADIWHEVDNADRDANVYGDLGGASKRFHELYDLAQRIDETIKEFFGLSDGEFFAKMS